MQMKALCFENCQLKSVYIPGYVEVIGESCFSGCRQLKEILFEDESQLKRIEKSCFDQCPLKSIVLPRNVEFIHGMAFVGCKCHSVIVDLRNPRLLVHEDFLLDKTESRLVRYFGERRDVNILANIEVLGESCFSVLELEAIIFDGESRVRRIEEGCFSWSSLKSIVIPRSVEFIGASAFACCKCPSLRVDPYNLRFSVRESFLFDQTEICLIRYFGGSNQVQIWADIEVLGESCFSDLELKAITFEGQTQMRRIEKCCFSRCSFKSICIPRNIEILGISCFLKCKQLESVIFEDESRLNRIEENCFSQCPLKSVCIPRNVEILGESCFSQAIIEEIMFKNESRLKRIEGYCFAGCSLKSICIHRTVESFGESCFEDCRNLVYMTIESGSRMTRIGELCLDDLSQDGCVDILSASDPETIQATLDSFWHIKEMIEGQSFHIAVGVRFDVGCGDIEIPANFKTLIRDVLHLYTSSESLVIPNWIEMIQAKDFLFCPRLQNVVVGINSRLREIRGFRNCALLEWIEIHSPVEIIRSEAFTSVTVSSDRRKVKSHHRVFVMLTDDKYLVRNRRRCHMLNAGKKTPMKITDGSS
jgi:hypothetical protein